MGNLHLPHHTVYAYLQHSHCDVGSIISFVYLQRNKTSVKLLPGTQPEKKSIKSLSSMRSSDFLSSWKKMSLLLPLLLLLM